MSGSDEQEEWYRGAFAFVSLDQKRDEGFLYYFGIFMKKRGFYYAYPG